MNAEFRPNLDRRVSTLVPVNANKVGARRPYQKGGTRYDFGPLGHLTLKDASEATGLPIKTLSDRLRRNLEPAALLSPYMQRRPSLAPPGKMFENPAGVYQGQSLALGIYLFRAYGMTPPTSQALITHLNCSRAQAYRLVRAYKDAIGLP